MPPPTGSPASSATSATSRESERRLMLSAGRAPPEYQPETASLEPGVLRESSSTHTVSDADRTWATISLTTSGGPKTLVLSRLSEKEMSPSTSDRPADRSRPDNSYGACPSLAATTTFPPTSVNSEIRISRGSAVASTPEAVADGIDGGPPLPGDRVRTGPPISTRSICSFPVRRESKRYRAATRLADRLTPLFPPIRSPTSVRLVRGPPSTPSRCTGSSRADDSDASSQNLTRPFIRPI